MSARLLRPSRRCSWIARADRASLAGMGLGLALMLLGPLLALALRVLGLDFDAGWAFRVGFFVVLGSTLAQIVFSHLAGEPE